jgi:hypothetical protein
MLHPILKIYSQRYLQILILLIFTLAYVASFEASYAIHNDYKMIGRNLLNINIRNLFANGESMHLFYIGRPINGLFFGLQQFLIGGLESIRNMRVFSLFLMLCIVFIACNHLRVKKVEREGGGQKGNNFQYLYCISILAIPSTALYVNWISTIIPGPFNILLALISWICFDCSYKKRDKIVLKIISFIILFITFLNYPPTAFFFLFIPFVEVICQDFDNANWREIKLKSISAIRFIYFTFITYFIVFKYVLFNLFRYIIGEGFASYAPEIYSFSLSINSNLLIDLNELFFSGLNFDLMTQNFNKYYLKLIYICSLLVGLFFISTGLLKRTFIFDKFKLLLIFFAATSLPFLLLEQSFIAYRIFFVYLAIFFVTILYLLITMINKILKDYRITLIFAYSCLILLTYQQNNELTRRPKEDLLNLERNINAILNSETYSKMEPRKLNFTFDTSPKENLNSSVYLPLDLEFPLKKSFGDPAIINGAIRSKFKDLVYEMHFMNSYCENEPSNLFKIAL